MKVVIGAPSPRAEGSCETGTECTRPFVVSANSWSVVITS